MKPVIDAATSRDLREVVKLVGELRAEILRALGYANMQFNPAETAAERADFLGYGDYVILLARSPRGHPLGFATVFEQKTQFEGAYGIVSEIFVRPEFRRREIANALLAEARAQARTHRWTRLEVNLPPASHLEGMLAFLESKRFTDAGANRRRLWL